MAAAVPKQPFAHFRYQQMPRQLDLEKSGDLAGREVKRYDREKYFKVTVAVIWLLSFCACVGGAIAFGITNEDPTVSFAGKMAALAVFLSGTVVCVGIPISQEESSSSEWVSPG